MIVTFCLMIPIVAWYSLKSVFVKAKDADLYKSAFKRLQYNPEIFDGLLQQQAKAPDGCVNGCGGKTGDIYQGNCDTQ